MQRLVVIIQFKTIGMVLLVNLLLSCATQNSQLQLQTSQKTDDLFVVDCLLPGQIRKLGQFATYLTSRRAIKTTAVDCGIRGGEYVAYDRANYLTALNIWLPKAQAGDAEAQNYVGEIYEKGLGIEPDYELAHVWYKKAATQGNTKAQVNLGYLYEQGLGVQQNKTIAMKWYGKSSNLSELNIPYATTLSSQPNSDKLSTELKLLKSDLKNSQAEANILKTKLAEMQTQLSDSKSKLSLLQQDATQVESKISDENSLASNKQNIGALQQLLSDKNQEINRQQSSVNALESEYQKEINRLNERLADTQKRAEQIIAELKKENDHASQAQVALLQVEAKLAETETQLLKVNNQFSSRLVEINQDSQNLKKKHWLDISAKVKEIEGLKYKLTVEKQRYESEIEKLKENVKTELSHNKPVIEIIDPPFVMTRGIPTVTLRSVVSQREIIGKIQSSTGLMSLSINDQKRDVDKQGLFKSNIKLMGNETPIQIVAVDNNGRKASLNFIISMNKAIKRTQNTKNDRVIKGKDHWETLDFGNYHALVIANNDYQKVPKLDTPISDAKVVDQVLREKYGFKSKLLLNATRYQILSELNKLRANLTDADNLLIYYAGHGELDQVNMRGHWLPIDADADNTANWISTVAITDILNSMSVKHIMVVSDSCYSGAMTRSSLARLDAGISSHQRNEWLKAMLKTRSRTVLTSGGLKPVMDGGGGQHSVFASAFIKALENNNQLLEGQALYREVSNNIISVAANFGIEQVPEYAPIRHAGHESGEFFFVPKYN